MNTAPRTPLQPVLLAGGSGTRLWPLSRRAYPKQFVPLLGEESLFAATLGRLNGLEHAAPMVVCNEEQRFLVAEEVRNSAIERASILLEPAGRNTAPAIALAALEARADDSDPILLVLPADHAIPDSAAFARAVEAAAAAAAAAAAEDGALVTFGIEPRSPATGYGYIKAAAGEGVRPVEAFVEKPDRATAEAWLAAGGYYWNSGMFVFRASAFLEELERHAPAMLKAVEKAHAGHTADLDFLRFDAAAFMESPAESVDYAVMEHTKRAVVVPFDGDWSDVGSWQALWEAGIAAGEGDAGDNVLHGDVITSSTERCFLHASHRLIAAVGLQDCVVVETADAVLVAPRERAQEVKKLVERLEADGRTEQDEHRRVFRPWGNYEGIDHGERFQVKRIVVDPGGCLSLQKHHHRAEHWVVVRGTAKVTSGEEQFLVTENQSTYIPLGTVHRLENPGHIPLELIEVQSGSYLGEDDIVRYEDQYGR
ncbi:mannose-1-phosphate guanylyltransferase/mannose-6-phosphate isomerase [Halofilum ochraceum]|uniref:mannose-1-phosphate guanylyltransferase/mannose-6-phosphate isomerase n=1 Tax=Halofilum ochraceum TaxID=1611323 RepID=UPI0008DAEC43|nr:mannose-1-phosphate guanylyltransferase/mannose-6-phosphate isomerase [Halofilum ochraceum]